MRRALPPHFFRALRPVRWPVTVPLFPILSPPPTTTTATSSRFHLNNPRWTRDSLWRLGCRAAPRGIPRSRRRPRLLLPCEHPPHPLRRHGRQTHASAWVVC